MMALDEFVLWVNADTPYKTARDYIAAAKAAPPDKLLKMGGTGTKQEDQIITVAIPAPNSPNGPCSGSAVFNRILSQVCGYQALHGLEYLITCPPAARLSEPLRLFAHGRVVGRMPATKNDLGGIAYGISRIPEYSHRTGDGI
jgi:hypothetical protein